LNFTNYNPTVGLTSVGSSNTSNDLFRAFYDFLVNSDSLRDRAGSLLNFESWQIQPIFIFKTHQPPNNDDNTCLVSTYFNNNIAGGNSTGVTNAHLLVVGFYDDVLKMKYNEYGKYDGLTIE